jgi:hypothetical protein
MMEIIIWIVSVVIVVFGSVLFFGPPYVPTLKKQVDAGLDLLDLKPGQMLLELGAGDGKVMKAAAERGLNVVGIELNPILVIVAKIRCWKYRTHTKVIWGSVWSVRWPQADGVFTFFLGREMAKLDRHIQLWNRQPVRVASFAFKIPGREIVDEKSGVFLYTYKKLEKVN